jgi:hypothetical protein
MTLPASGQISMSQVRTELSASAQISLGQTSVRTLFGVASGQIALSNGYGKSAVSIYRPTSSSTVGTVSTPANAYDTDPATLATWTSQNGASPGVTTYTGFSGGVITGYLRVKYSFTADGLDGDATATVDYSVNGGSSWSGFLGASNTGVSSSQAVTTGSISLSSVTMSNLRVRVTCTSGGYGYATIDVYDITFGS